MTHNNPSTKLKEIATYVLSPVSTKKMSSRVLIIWNSMSCERTTTIKALLSHRKPQIQLSKYVMKQKNYRVLTLRNNAGKNSNFTSSRNSNTLQPFTPYITEKVPENTKAIQTRSTHILRSILTSPFSYTTWMRLKTCLSKAITDIFLWDINDFELISFSDSSQNNSN